MQTAFIHYAAVALLFCSVQSREQGSSSDRLARLEPASLIHQVNPTYPSQAHDSGIEGDVILEYQVNKEGDVANVQLMSGHPMLVDAAVAAVRQWKYTPFRKDGVPVEADRYVRVNFSLDRGVTIWPYSPHPLSTPGIVGAVIGSSPVTPPHTGIGPGVRVASGVEQGLLISQVKPVYPPAARAAGIEGLVLLQAQISKEGDIFNLQLVSGQPVLAAAAFEAVKQWKYKPYLLNGEPVVVDTEIQVNFSLAKNQNPALPTEVTIPFRPPDESAWTLTWSDEFNGPNGSAPDPAKWTYDTGGNGWGNNELEYYTDRPQNAYQQDGNLVIKVLAEKFTGADGVTRDYTSARLKTLGKFSRAYGRFEARIKIPRGQGIWPAFWMLGADIGVAGWPACGEIDIMENIGKETGLVHGTLHGPGYSGDHSLGAPFGLGPQGAASDQNFADDFHVYAVEWEPQAIRFYVDDHLYETRTSADLPAGAKWVYDHPFFILLNVAVGGSWPGNPDATSTYPQTMLVDYVRVYQRSDKIQITPAQ